MKARAAILAILFGLAIAGCGSADTSSQPTGPSASPTAPAATAVTIATPSAVTVATPSAVATSSPAGSVAACPVEPQAGVLPSDRITNVEVVARPDRDVIQFVFGDGSLEPEGVARGTLAVAEPPFTGAASGLPIDLHGEHALQVVFKGMSLQNDVGQPVYDGPREFEVTDASRSLRHAVMFDESEGQIGWYVGYDGPGCVSLTRTGNTVVLAIDLAPAS